MAAGFEPVREHLDAQLAEQPGHSAQLAVQVDGRRVVDLWGGPHLGETSVTGVYSATKGIAAITLATLVRDGRLDLDERVAAYWPEFGGRGKDAVSVRQLLSHQAGLVNTRRGPDVGGVLRLAAGRGPACRRPARRGARVPPPATTPLTIGPLVEELVRRVAGTSVQDLYESRVRRPRGIDFFLGLPAEEEPRYVDLLPWTGLRAQPARQRPERPRTASRPTRSVSTPTRRRSPRTPPAPAPSVPRRSAASAPLAGWRRRTRRRPRARTRSSTRRRWRSSPSCRSTVRTWCSEVRGGSACCS